MTPKSSLENQRRFIAEKKAQGLKRLTLWVKPEDVGTHQMAAQQPHALNRLRKRIERELRPKIEAEVRDKLRRRTERAMLVQKRAQVRRQTAGSNRPPELIRFERRPPAAARNRIKAAGALYDPVAAVWNLPDDPEAWPTCKSCWTNWTATASPAFPSRWTGRKAAVPSSNISNVAETCLRNC